MNFLEKALELAEKGFYVFPVQVGGKLPAINDFPNRATRDPEQIKKFWLDPVFGMVQPYNIGISTTKFNGSQALVVVDVDNKGNKKGDEVIKNLQLAGYDFIETATQETPSGGRHLIYRTKTPVKQGESVLGHGLDIRSRGGYILAEGSVIKGKEYKFVKRIEVKECPDWIIKKCGEAPVKEERPVKPIEINVDSALARAKHYLLNEAPIAYQGDGGDQTTYVVAAHLKDLGVNKTDTLDLMLEHWNDRCEPAWSPEDLQTKVNNAFQYGNKAPGALAPETQFKPVEGETKETNFLKEMNKEFALLFEDGGYTIIHETVDEKGNPRRMFMPEVAFRKMFCTDLVQVGKGYKSKAELWIDWKGRRTYNGICFKPEQTANNNYYNLWTGFNCKPKPYNEATPQAKLGFDLFIDHAKKNVCGGDDSLFQWLMGYFAHIIQRPWERPLTTLVFRGRKGVGKNALVDRVGRLIGTRSYLVAHNSRYLTSNFNGHLDSCLCLVLDEAFWSGDKSAEGLLKGITTAPTIMIERKGKEPYVIDNIVRLIVIGNEEWLVPASSDERRYAVLDVGEGNKQDGKYFSKMRELMDNKGGCEILMHYLKHFDLSKVDVNVAPITQGLMDQKIESMGMFQQFWKDCLHDGRIVNSDFDDSWSQIVDKDRFKRALVSYLKERNVKSWVPTDSKITRELKKLHPSINARKRVTVGEKRERMYEFSDLETCRREFEKCFGVKVDWS